ncbi:hypothetical protein FisN_40Lh006 [Fistulifera solaris]|uniref:Uncharacterized protein n=1 Tax=Fistulifera solaris TaxID=1519565 RepID=A0A1Z5J999_FISSO|nr:hypothetical protein FisN_40Lh006 [Fistulifera solaris]|eukprot:GAX10539.1 hypothetical protein FisN_40Lh006 [Fistulifera solaris]
MFPSSPRHKNSTMFPSSPRTSLTNSLFPPRIIFIYADALEDSDDISCCSMQEEIKVGSAAERRWSADLSESSASHDSSPSMPRRS